MLDALEIAAREGRGEVRSPTADALVRLGLLVGRGCFRITPAGRKALADEEARGRSA